VWGRKVGGGGGAITATWSKKFAMAAIS